MGGSIILSTKRTKTPYYVDELGLSIYTIEELCYYMYHYLEFLEDEFINAELLDFIENSMGLKTLAQKVVRWAGGGSDFGQIILMIEQDVHYLNADEMSDLKARLEWRRSAKPVERFKKKADTLVVLGKHRHAIAIYDELLERERVLNLSSRTKGRVFHNRGIAYARLFMFGEASESLELAYSLLQSPEILKEIYFLQFIDSEAVGAPICLDDVSPEMISEWKAEITHYMKEAEKEPEYKAIVEAANQDSYKKSAFYYELIRQWKNEYRNMVK